MSPSLDGPRVDVRNQRYNLRSGRHIVYVSPLLSRVPRSPARDINNVPTLLTAAQLSFVVILHVLHLLTLNLHLLLTIMLHLLHLLFN